MPGAKAAFAPLPAAPLSVPGFDGPLELLLALLDAGELEITRVSLLGVTEQYLAFLRLLPVGAYRMDCLAEFLVVGTHLLLLKSRALLPRPPVVLADEEAPDEADLAARLAAYRRVRDAALELRERQERGDRAFARQAAPPLPPAGPPPRLERAAPELLTLALQRLLASRATPPPDPGAPPRVTLAERIAELRRAVTERGPLPFTWLAGGCESRADVIITFLAILELYRARAVRLEQDQPFGEIWLRPVASPG